MARSKKEKKPQEEDDSVISDIEFDEKLVLDSSSDSDSEPPRKSKKHSKKSKKHSKKKSKKRYDSSDSESSSSESESSSSDDSEYTSDSDYEPHYTHGGRLQRPPLYRQQRPDNVHQPPFQPQNYGGYIQEI